MQHAPWWTGLWVTLLGTSWAAASPAESSEVSSSAPAPAAAEAMPAPSTSSDRIDVPGRGERVAFFPEGMLLGDDTRRLWDTALRDAMTHMGLVLLPDDERALHVRSARTLGLGCQLDTSPACLAFLSELAGLSYVFVASASEGQMRLMRFGLEEGEIIELGRSELVVSGQEVSYGEAARALLARTFVDRDIPALSSAPHPKATPDATPAGPTPAGRAAGMPEASGEPTAELAATDFSEPLAPESVASEATTPTLDPAWLAAWVGSGMIMGGGASLAASQWLAHTPFQGALPSAARVRDRLAWVDATQWTGLGLLGAGATVGVAGAALALGQGGGEE